MSEHPCPECQRMHLSDAEERARSDQMTRRLRGLNATLVKGIKAVPPSYGTQQMADFLTGYLAPAVLFSDTLEEMAAPGQAGPPESGDRG